MNKICKILFFVFVIFLCSPCLAYQIGVWDTQTGLSNPALQINFNSIKVQKLSRENFSQINEKNYPVIVFTKYTGLDENTYETINSYIKRGGKIILALPQNTYEENMYTKLAKELGVKVNSITKTTEPMDINWIEKTIVQNQLPKNSKIAKVSLNKASHLAVFGEIERHESAISLNTSGAVFSWCWGHDGNSFFNEKSMHNVLEELLPKEQNRQISPQISFNGVGDDIEKLRHARDYIEKYQDIPINYSYDISEAQQNLELSKVDEMWALYYKHTNPREYSKYLKLAQEKTFCAVKGIKDPSPAENRGIWFDRGTIVNIKSRSEMGRYFETLKNSGINTVYFETLNAGYTIYPSKIATQNPLVKGRDPLAWAIDEAHSRGMKIQAWMWVFAVGNDRHNKLIDKDNNYVGPVLEKNMRWALLGENGNFRPKNQPEFWVDPSNKEGVNYLLSIIEEVVKKYNVDGIQLDYIRYPFQSSDNLMGFNHNSAEEFSSQTGVKLYENNYKTNVLWNKWKENNINSFVKNVYTRTKHIKPNIKVSAAIFTKSHQNRLTTIQQNWESWAGNGYIDSLTPMSYSTSISALSSNLAPLKTQIGNCPIYPGVALQHVDELGIMQQTFKIREEGFPGVSFFAMAQLSPNKSQLLKNGFYSQKVQDPTYDTKTSAILLLQDYRAMLNVIQVNNNDINQNQKSAIASLITRANEAISQINSGKYQNALDTIKKLQPQNSAFYKSYGTYNGLRKQTADGYLKKAENLLKIYMKKNL